MGVLAAGFIVFGNIGDILYGKMIFYGCTIRNRFVNTRENVVEKRRWRFGFFGKKESLAFCSVFVIKVFGGFSPP